MNLEADADIAYYACGGGLGHVTRAAAIIRQLHKLTPYRATVLTNAPLRAPLDCEHIPFISVNGPEELRTKLPTALAQLSPKTLVMDVFPTGILGELAEILPTMPCKKALVMRRVKESYRSHILTSLPLFDKVLLAEQVDFMPSDAIPCLPILIRDAGEILPRESARALMGITGDEPVVLAVSTGDVEWTGDFFRLLQKIWRRNRVAAHLRLATPDPAEEHPLLVRHYPLMGLFAGVDLLIGAGGYNLVTEARACGVPAIFLPQPRRYDDQYARVASSVVAESPEQLEEHIMDFLRAPRSRVCAQFDNGAARAAQVLAEMIENR